MKVSLFQKFCEGLWISLGLLMGLSLHPERLFSNQICLQAFSNCHQQEILTKRSPFCTITLLILIRWSSHDKCMRRLQSSLAVSSTLSHNRWTNLLKGFIIQWLWMDLIHWTILNICWPRFTADEPTCWNVLCVIRCVHIWQYQTYIYLVSQHMNQPVESF